MHLGGQKQAEGMHGVLGVGDTSDIHRYIFFGTINSASVSLMQP